MIQMIHFFYVAITSLQENNNKLFGFASVNSPHNEKFHSNDMSQKRHEIKTNGNLNGNKVETTTEKFVWGFQTIPTLYSIYQKVFRINSYQFIFLHPTFYDLDGVFFKLELFPSKESFINFVFINF